MIPLGRKSFGNEILFISYIKLLTEGIQELKGLKELMERLEGEPQAIDI